MHKGKRKGAAVYWAAGFIVACYLAQTANCHRPKETGQRRGPTIGVREGTIVFGRGAESHVANGNRKAPSNASAVEDERAYQADSAGLSNGQAQDTSPREASWKRMAPSLQCGGDQMKFRAVGPGASQFAVDQGNAHPMPLSQIPSTCGYTMQRNSLALVMLVPYDGCNIVQEGGSYMLPMLWQGIPVSLWCNKPPATTPAPATTSAQPQDPVPQTLKYPPSYPQVPLMPPESMNPGVQQPYVLAPYWGYPHYHSVPTTTTAAPTTMATLPTTAKPAAKDPEAMVQFPGYPPFYPWYLPGPLPTPAETTTTTQKMTTKPTTTQSQFPQVPQWPSFPHFPPYGPQMPQFPPYGPFQPFPHHHWALPGPLPTPAETTTTQKMTTKPTTTQSQFPQVPQLPKFPPYGPQMPQFPPYGPFQPFPHHHWPLPGPLPTPAETTTTQKMTTKPTTTQSQFPQLPKFPPYGPFQPFPHYHWPLPGPLPTPAETTTTQKMTTKPTTTQSQFPQLPKFPPYGPFQPFPHYHWPLPGPLPTPAETTTTKKTTKPPTTQYQVPKFPPYGPQLLPFPPYGPQIPYGPYPPYPFPQFIPPFAPKYPTSKPETTTVTPEPTRQTTATKGKNEPILTPVVQYPSNVKLQFPVLQFPFQYAPPPGLNKMV